MTHPRIIIFYHTLFGIEEGGVFEEKPVAFGIVHEFVSCLRQSGLLEACEEFHVGINGGPESEDYAKIVLPPKAQMVFHGLKSRAENLTLVELEQWVKSHPGQEAYILYAHCKGASHAAESGYSQTVATPWRQAMTACSMA